MPLGDGSHNSMNMRNKIVLDKITFNKNLVLYDFHTNNELNSFFKTHRMFIQYEEDVADVPLSLLTIPFVNTMAGISWLSDSVLFVDEIDATFFESFKQLKRSYSELHRIQLKGMFVPSRIVKNVLESDTKQSLLLFGGGVDCHTSFLRNRKSISHIVNIYGWLNSIDETNAVDISDEKTTAQYAKQMGVEAIHIRSNFASLFNLHMVDKKLCAPIVGTSYWYGFLHSMAFLSISSVFAWKYGISNLIIASSFTKDRADVHCASFITTDSEFKFATHGNTLHDGFELDRQDKVKILVDYQRETEQPYKIQACSFNDHNCCKCEKCFRTIVELVAENADPRDFGFNDIQGSLKQHWERIVSRDVALWGTTKEGYYFYHSALRMRENYENLNQEQKEFVDWFLSFDFAKAKQEGLRKYYRQNFFSIIKRKLHL